MEQLFQRLAPSCAMVLKKNPATNAVDFLGSAFAARPDGYLFTAAEVVKGESELLVSPAEDALGFQPSTREQLRCFAAQVRGLDAVNNVALLKITDPIALRLPPDFLGDSEAIRPGAELMHLGFPFGRYGSLILTSRSGRLAAKILTPEGKKQLLVEGTMYSGSAGGPLIDARRGCVVGILSNQLAILPKEGSTQAATLPSIGTSLSIATPVEAARALLQAER